MTPRIQRLAGIGFLAVIGALIAFNLFVVIRNQHDGRISGNDRFKLRPRSLALAARQNPMETVSTTYAAWYTMREHLAGTHLRLPGILRTHQVALERVSRIAIEMGAERIELPSAVVQRLFDTATTVWSMEPGNLTGLVAEPGATRYVLVVRPEDVARMVVISEARYQRELAAAAPPGRAP